MKVILKFGGSSVGTPERIQQVAEVIRHAKTQKTVLAVVVSAFQGITDELILLAHQARDRNDSYELGLKALRERHLTAVHQLVAATNRGRTISDVTVLCHELESILRGIFLLGEATLRSIDMVMSFGERLSSLILTKHLQEAGVASAVWIDARSILRTDSNFGAAKIDFAVTDPLVREVLGKEQGLPIIPGFLAQTADGATTTLGRGGSDYTAAVLGGALAVDEIEIWTDVDGMLTSDPRKVAEAIPLREVSYEEAHELCHFGAKVIYPPTLQPAMARGIPIVIKNTFNPSAEGTRIVREVHDRRFVVTGVSSIENVALLRIQGPGLVGVAGTAHRFFGALAKDRINVILITQASSEHTICCAVMPHAAEAARAAVDSEFAYERSLDLVHPLIVENDRSIISVVGDEMRNSRGVAGRVFTTMGSSGVNVVAIAQGSSERNISIVVYRRDERKALSALHDEFFLGHMRHLNVYLIGTGTVGAELLKQIERQAPTLRESNSVEINMRGVANSKTMTFRDDDGKTATLPFSLETFLDHAKEDSHAHTVLVDCTSSEEVAASYIPTLEAGVAIVTPNKRAFSGSLASYRRLADLAATRGTPLYYETTVGAALPVLSTLHDLVHSGDTILEIEAVLSGTLSFIFSGLSADRSLSKLVSEARELGLTEPDPREDLSGRDVLRKVLILARRSGLPLELTDIEQEKLLPDSYEAMPSVEEFLRELPKLDQSFETRRAAAEKKGEKLIYSACISGEKRTAAVRLREVPLSHPFASLGGSDNMIVFRTARYREQPLVIRGPGAGSAVTAMGVFADILRVARPRNSESNLYVG